MSRKTPSIPPARAWSIVPPIVDAEEIQIILGCGRSHLDDLLREGLPALNVGFEHRAGSKGTGRTRRMLRFEVDKVIAWLRSRSRGAA
jgi:hypothetical protein